MASISPEQTGFFFETPLVDLPPSHLPQPRVIEPHSLQVRELLALSGPDLVECLRQIASTMPDDISYDDLLAEAGFPSLSIMAWHRSRAMEALLPPEGQYQAYQPAPGQVRFQRLYRCKGYEDTLCESYTGGGVLCARCRKLEEEDLFNQE